MANASVGIRLKLDGKTEIQQGFQEVTASGEAEARKLSAAYDRAGDMLVEAQRKQSQASAKLAVILPNTDVQNRIAATTGISGGADKSARDSAAAIRDLLREQERFERQAVALRSVLDPLGAAQSRLDTELAQYTRLAQAGVISTKELAQAQGLARTRFDETTAALKRQGGASPAAAAGRLNLARQGADVFTQLGSGASPSMVAIQQGPQILDALYTSGIKIPPMMLAVGGAVAAAGAAFVVAGKAALDYEAGQAKLALTLGYTGRASGLTVSDLNRVADAAAATGTVSATAAREMEVAFLSTGKIGGGVLQDLITVQADYAAATGQKSKEATEALARAFADPAAGAKELTDQFHFLDAATLEQIKSMTEAGDRAAAQRLLMDQLQPALAGAADRVTGLDAVLRDLKNGFDEAYVAAGRFMDRILHGVPNAQRLADLQRERAGATDAERGIFSEGGSIGVRRSTAEIDRDIALAQDQAEQEELAAQRRANAAALRDKSIVARSAVERLNPKSTQIASIRDGQDLARQALANPALLAAMGKTRQEVELSIAAGDKQIAALSKVKTHVDRHAQSLARQAESMTVAAAQSWVLADAYLQGDAAGVKAEARRKALTDATRKGIGVEAQAARQLALAVAERAAQGAKAVGQLAAENDARRAANDNLKAGAISSADLNRALSDEAALRPLLTLRALAHGKELEKLNRIIAEYRKELGEAHKEEARSSAYTALEGLDKRIADARFAKSMADQPDDVQERLSAFRAAINTANENNYSPEDSWAFVGKTMEGVQTEQDARRGRVARDMLTDQRERASLLQAEIGLVGASAAQHDAVLGRLRLEQQLRREGISAESEKGRVILLNFDREQSLTDELNRQKQSWDELQQAGERLVDDMSAFLTPDGWNNWRDTGMRVFQDLIGEAQKLAIINPLKNFLFGGDRTTLSSAGGFLSSIFGGGGGQTFSFASPKLIPGLAGGTDSAAGGTTLVGEEGPELVNLPRGSSVTPAVTTRDLVKAIGGGGAGPVSVHFGDTYIQGTTGSPQEMAALLDQRDARLKAEMPGVIQNAINRRAIKMAA